MPKTSSMPLRTAINKWYFVQENKMQKVEEIRELTHFKYARPTVIQWLNGVVETKKQDQLDAISKVSGIEISKIYER